MKDDIHEFDQTSSNTTDLEKLGEHLTPEKHLSVMSSWTQAGGRGLDHEALTLAGVFAHAEQIARFLDTIAANTPKLIGGALQTSLDSQNKVNNAVVQQLENLFTRIESSYARVESAAIRSTNEKKQIMLLAGMGGAVIAMVVSTVLSQLIFLPAQLRQLRGADAPALEWLNTADGGLFRQILKSGNTSTASCVRRARAAGITKQKGRTPCLIDIDLRG
jgi:hypothetical protein